MIALILNCCWLNKNFLADFVSHFKCIQVLILFQNSWYSLIASYISFNLMQGFRYLQFKPDALHRLDARHPKRYTITLTKMLADFVSHFKRLICPSANKRN